MKLIEVFEKVKEELLKADINRFLFDVSQPAMNYGIDKFGVMPYASMQIMNIESEWDKDYSKEIEEAQDKSDEGLKQIAINAINKLPLEDESVVKIVNIICRLEYFVKTKNQKQELTITIKRADGKITIETKGYKFEKEFIEDAFSKILKQL